MNKVRKLEKGTDRFEALRDKRVTDGKGRWLVMISPFSWPCQCWPKSLILRDAMIKKSARRYAI